MLWSSLLTGQKRFLKRRFIVFQRREHSHHGAAGYDLRAEVGLCQEHHRRRPLLSLQQTVQAEEERLGRLQAAGIHVG